MEPMSGARKMADRVGNEREVDMPGAMKPTSMTGGGKSGYGRNESKNTHHAPGTAAGESSLSGAVGELHKQHPHPYTDHGPFRSHTPQPKGDK